MRRIDLFCKLIGPLAIALIDGLSPRISVLTTLGLNLASMMVEYGLIARVYHAIPALEENTERCTTDVEGITLQSSLPSKIRSGCFKTGMSLKAYIKSPAFLPSFSLSLLYLTVLSFSGQMTTYLLTFPKLTAPIIGGVRTVATVFELGSTWLAPHLISRIGPTRAGIWCLSWQIICLSASVSTFFYAMTGSSLAKVSLLIASVVLSRVGLYAFDLVAQLIIQGSIPSNQRGSFSATEASLQNLFELFTFLTTIVFPNPDQFRIPAFISFTAVCLAGAIYAMYVRDRRGHLLHLPCGDWAKGHWHAGHEDLDREANMYEMVQSAEEN